jgi:hypothetical protein
MSDGDAINSSPSASFTLLVNSCDAFEDCWFPFFTLLERYWPAPRPKIILNTEYKDWSFPSLAIETTAVQHGIERRLSWSECLSRALDKVETPLLLYMQEDYFIEAPVDVGRVEDAAAMMLADPSIRYVGLTHFGAGTPILPDARPNMSRIGARATYRLSTQAGLWRTDTLRSYLLPWESGWMFELLGTVRSWKRDELFLTLDRQKTAPAVVYQHTGIVKGQWSSFVPALFAREGIAVDFAERGFHDEGASALTRRLRLLRQVTNNPAKVAKSILAR